VKSLFITATNTDIGKTYTTLKLIEAFSQQGILVGVCKPIETGVTDEPVDAKVLLEAVQKRNPNFRNLKPTDITAYTFELPAAPFCADITKSISIKTIKEKIFEMQQRCDLLIIEGAGGLMVPITANYYMIDLIEDLNTKTLLVTPSQLGCINDTLLSINALKNRALTFDWCVNMHKEREEFKKVTEPYYNEIFQNWWEFDKGLKHFINKFF